MKVVCWPMAENPHGAWGVEITYILVLDLNYYVRFSMLQ